MKSRWLVLTMAAFLVFLVSPMGVLACQKAMNTAYSGSEDMGFSSSGSEYGTEEMAPASPEGFELQGERGLLDEWRDEMTPSSPEGYTDQEELTPSGSGSDFDEYSNQGSSADQGSEIYYP